MLVWLTNDKQTVVEGLNFLVKPVILNPSMDSQILTSILEGEQGADKELEIYIHSAFCSSSITASFIWNAG